MLRNASGTSSRRTSMSVGIGISAHKVVLGFNWVALLVVHVGFQGSGHIQLPSAWHVTVYPGLSYTAGDLETRRFTVLLIHSPTRRLACSTSQLAYQGCGNCQVDRRHLHQRQVKESRIRHRQGCYPFHSVIRGPVTYGAPTFKANSSGKEGCNAGCNFIMAAKRSPS